MKIILSFRNLSCGLSPLEYHPKAKIYFLHVGNYTVSDLNANNFNSTFTLAVTEC